MKIMENNDNKTGYSALVVDGVEYQTLLTDKYKNRTPYAETNHNLLRAFIPGTIVEVYVKTGKKVKEGDTLLILEAMKMRNQVKAPFNGTVKKMLVKKNDLVSKNQVMIELE